MHGGATLYVYLSAIAPESITIEALHNIAVLLLLQCYFASSRNSDLLPRAQARLSADVRRDSSY